MTRKKRPILKVDEATKELLKSEVYRLQTIEHCTIPQIMQKTGLARRTIVRYLAEMRTRATINETIIAPSSAATPVSKRQPPKKKTTSGPQADTNNVDESPSNPMPKIPQLANANPDELLASITTMAMQKAMASDDPRWATLMITLMDKMKVIKPPEQQQFTQLPKYSRPSELNPDQHEIIDAIVDDNTKLVFIEGDRRVGKSTVGFLGMCECILLGRLRWDMWASKGDAARRLHRDMVNDPLTRDSVKDIIAQSISNRTNWYNGGQLCIHDTTVADSKGIGGDGIIIDELDQVLLHNKEAFAAIIGILRDKPKMKVIFIANRDTGAYKLLREVLHDESIVHNSVRFFTLTSDRSPHIQKAGNDRIIGKLMTVAMGEAYTAQALHNRESHEGEVFNPDFLSKAYLNFDEWALLYAPRNYQVYISIDPGFGHATGIIGCAVSNDTYEFRGTKYHLIWELFSKAMAGSDYNDFNSSVVDYVCGHAKECLQYAGCTRVTVLTESNNSGLIWAQQIQNRGYTVVKDNFGRDTWWTAKTAYCDTVNYYLLAQMLHLRNLDLKSEMSIFSLKEGADDEHKGNITDALLHLVYIAAGGVSFVQHMAESERDLIPNKPNSTAPSNLIFRK